RVADGAVAGTVSFCSHEQFESVDRLFVKSRDGLQFAGSLQVSQFGEQPSRVFLRFLLCRKSGWQTVSTGELIIRRVPAGLQCSHIFGKAFGGEFYDSLRAKSCSVRPVNRIELPSVRRTAALALVGHYDRVTILGSSSLLPCQPSHRPAGQCATGQVLQ